MCVYTHITAVSTNKSVTEHIIHICIFHTASSKIHYTACILETITSMYVDVWLNLQNTKLTTH